MLTFVMMLGMELSEHDGANRVGSTSRMMELRIET